MKVILFNEDETLKEFLTIPDESVEDASAFLAEVAKSLITR